MKTGSGSRWFYTASYPFLLVAVRILYLAANNPGEYSAHDLLLTLGTCLAATAVVFVLAAILLRRRGAELPALVTLILVAWIFGAPALSNAPWSPPSPGSTAAGLVGSTLLVVGLARRPAALELGARYLTHIYGILTLWLGADIGLDWQRQRREIAQSPLGRALSLPVALDHPSEAPKPDIYLIVLDEYANDSVLRRVVGFNNGAFVDSLRALGFHVPASVRSNYAHTYLSLASLLNAAHVYPLERELPPGTTDRTLANHLLARSRVSRLLRGQGYRFVFFPSSWWYATQTNTVADSVVDVLPGFSLGRAVSRTGFRRALWQASAVAWFYREAEGDAEIVRRTLHGIEGLAREPGPKFVFAHLMSPHRPYVLTRSCLTRPAGWRREAAAYVAQLQCLNTIILRTVGRLIRDSARPPIIVLQGDHGTSFLEYSNAPTVSRVSIDAARERFGAFGAYYLPTSGSGILPDSVSVVNVMGDVLRAYFGARLAAQTDGQYMSLEQHPFAFRRMDLD
jgi:hypothetical protein